MMMRLVIISLILLTVSGFSLNKDDFYLDSYVLETNFGKIRVTLFDEIAPLHAKNFKENIKNKVYENKVFHRVVRDFVIQTGEYENKKEFLEAGKNNSQKSLIPNEISKIHFKGALGAARKDDQINPDKKSDKLQFYIALRPLVELNGNYTVFGRVSEGLEVVTKIANLKTAKDDFPLEDVRILKAYQERYFDLEKYQRFKREEESKND